MPGWVRSMEVLAVLPIDGDVVDLADLEHGNMVRKQSVTHCALPRIAFNFQELTFPRSTLYLT